MEGIQVSTEVAGSQGEIAIIKVGGFIDTTTSAEVERALGNLLKRKQYKIIIDLGNVDYISSAGWGIFISEIKTIRENEGDLKLARMIPDVYEIFELLEFHHILEVYDSLQEAILSFGQEKKEPEPAVESAVQQALRQRGAVASTSERVASDATETAAPSATVADEAAVTPKKLPLSMYTDEEKIKHIVAEHPEWGAFKINKRLNSEKYGFTKIGWFGVRAILNRLNLNSRKKRQEFAEHYQKTTVK